jgi:hypothetical protein
VDGSSSSVGGSAHGSAGGLLVPAPGSSGLAVDDGAAVAPPLGAAVGLVVGSATLLRALEELRQVAPASFARHVTDFLCDVVPGASVVREPGHPLPVDVTLERNARVVAVEAVYTVHRTDLGRLVELAERARHLTVSLAVVVANIPGGTVLRELNEAGLSSPAELPAYGWAGAVFWWDEERQLLSNYVVEALSA